MEGDYTQVLYQREIVAGNVSVTVEADVSETSLIITEGRTTVFRIGDYDGTPTGLLNANKFVRLQPSDDRMSSWSPDDFVVGKSEAGDFPMALFEGVNSGSRINSTLPAIPDGGVTIRIATTRARIQARQAVWTAVVSPGGFGVFRGYGEMYSWTFKAESLIKGDNNLEINVVSWLRWQQIF